MKHLVGWGTCPLSQKISFALTAATPPLCASRSPDSESGVAHLHLDLWAARASLKTASSNTRLARLRLLVAFACSARCTLVSLPGSLHAGKACSEGGCMLVAMLVANDPSPYAMSYLENCDVIGSVEAGGAGLRARSE